MLTHIMAFGMGIWTAAVPPTLDSVTAGIEKRIEREEIRGAVLGVQQGADNRITGFGRTGPQNPDSPGPATLFEIGSISKVFTALLAQRQVQAGRASWDEPISQRISGTFADPRVGAITWRELASHSSGLPRLPDNMPMENALDPYAGFDRALLDAYLLSYRPASLEKQYAYSNLGMGLLGELAANAAGLPYAEALQRDVFEPLGMNDTAVAPAPQKLKRMATGFSQGADMPRWGGFDALAGAGAIVSTASDLLRFAHLNANPAEAGAMAASLAAIREVQGSGETALGWHIEKSAGDSPVFWHNGGTGGFASALAVDPSKGLSVVLLAASTDYNGITELALAQLAGEVEAPADGPDLSPYVGTFQVSPAMVLTFFLDDGQLFGQATGQGAFPLAVAGEHAFSFEPAGITLSFEDFADSRAQTMVMVQAGRTTRAPRVADDKGIQRMTEIEIDAASLAPLAGVYALTPAVKITVEARDGQLFAQLTGQPAFPVFPFEPDKFFYKVVDAQLHFERDDSGAVSGLTLVQGGRQYAPKQP
ncbi:MAG: serine hydrolase [Pseudomonadota bacterium]